MNVHFAKRSRGYLYVCLALILVGMMFWGAGLRDAAPWWTNAPALALVASVLGYRGARYLKRDAAGAGLDSDQRAPVLLLRPFNEDNAVVGSGPRVFSPYAPSTWKKLRNPHALWLSYRALFSFHVTFEQILRFGTRNVGPLVAIGPPGAPAILGANNVFAGEEWKEVVADLAARSQLVVLVAGSTPGLLWEVNFMLTSLTPEKCLIFIPDGAHRWWWPFTLRGTRQTIWNAFRHSAGRSFPQALPAQLQGAACLGFASDWKPIVLNPAEQPKTTEPRTYVAYMLTAIT